MLEALLAATATSGLLVLARGHRRPGAVGEDWVLESDDEDLPCPWCYSQTDAHDDRCGSCGRRFG